MEAQDVLADQVHVGRPVFLEQFVRFFIHFVAQAADIVRQRVDPDVDHVLRIEIHRHAPFETGAGDAEVLEARQQEIVHDLVLA